MTMQIGQIEMAEIAHRAALGFEQMLRCAQGNPEEDKFRRLVRQAYAVRASIERGDLVIVPRVPAKTESAPT